MKYKLFIPLLCVLTLTSCNVPNWWKPLGYITFRQMPKGGTPGFELGWIHGCQSGLGSQFGGAIYMNFYTWSRDPDIMSDNPPLEKLRKRYPKRLKGVQWNNPANVKKNFSDYQKVFWAAHIFCRHVVLGQLGTADMAPPNPNDPRYDMSKHHLGSIWRINGKGDTRFAKGGLW